MDAVLVELGAILNRFDAECQSISSSPDVSPFLLVHPSSSRTSHIESTRSHLKTIDTYLDCAAVLESKLTTARATLMRRKLMYASALSPISALPQELLSIVLNDAAQMQAKAAVKLAQVCRSWYHTVVRQPSLWSHIQLRGDKFYHIAPPLICAVDVPVHLTVTEHPTKRVSQEVATYLQSRLVSAKIEGARQVSSVWDFFGRVRGKMSALETLEVTHFSGDVIMPLHLRPSLPCLQSIEPRFSHQPTALQHFSVSRMSGGMMYRMLGEVCKTLRSLKIAMVDTYGDNHTLWLEMEKLEALHFDDLSGKFLEDVLD